MNSGVSSRPPPCIVSLNEGATCTIFSLRERSPVTIFLTMGGQEGSTERLSGGNNSRETTATKETTKRRGEETLCGEKDLRKIDLLMYPHIPIVRVIFKTKYAIFPINDIFDGFGENTPTLT